MWHLHNATEREKRHTGTVAKWCRCFSLVFSISPRLPYNLYCVGGDVKHCTIQSNSAFHQCCIWIVFFYNVALHRLTFANNITVERVLLVSVAGMECCLVDRCWPAPSGRRHWHQTILTPTLTSTNSLHVGIISARHVIEFHLLSLNCQKWAATTQCIGLVLWKWIVVTTVVGWEDNSSMPKWLDIRETFVLWSFSLIKNGLSHVGRISRVYRENDDSDMCLCV